MSLQMRLGKRGNLLDPRADSYKQVKPRCPSVVSALSCLAQQSSVCQLLCTAAGNNTPF